MIHLHLSMTTTETMSSNEGAGPSWVARFLVGSACALLLPALAAAASPPAACVAACVAASACAPDGVGGPGGPRIANLLLAARRQGDSVEQIRDAAAAFGSASIPALLDVLEAGTFHEKRKGGGIVVHALDDTARLGLASALGAFQWESVRRWIEHRLEGEPTLQTRSSLLFVLGAAAPDESLADLLTPISSLTQPQGRALRQPLEEALAAALARDPELGDELRALFVNTPPTFLRSVIAAVKKSGDQAALDRLARLLGSIPDADPLLMIEISDLAKTVVRPVPIQTLDRLRVALTSRTESVQLEAAKALGRLDDVAAVPALIEALRSTSSPLRIEAKIALDRLTAERYGSDASAWAQWYSDSQRWLAGEAPRWRAYLRSDDQGRVARALLQVARYRIYRYDFVEDVAAALATGDENTCVVACAVLGHFATPDSIEPLLLALDHPLIEVRKAALEALVRATGANLGEYAAEWRAAGWPLAGRQPGNKPPLQR